MPDITMCDNNACPQKVNCYRFTATPNYHQSFTIFEPTPKGCNFFQPNKHYTPVGNSTRCKCGKFKSNKKELCKRCAKEVN